MRESLTILAILLIVVLTTALVGPYFVDWNAQRGAIETRLSDLLGAKVTVAGPIDVKLLPRPIFKLQAVTLAGTRPGAPSGTVDRLDMELAIAGLLRGQIQFVDAELTRPRLTLVTRDRQSVLLPRLSATSPDRVAIDSVTIHDGSLAVQGPDGRSSFAVAGLQGEGGAESLSGPFHFSGRLDTARGPVPFKIATGELMSGRLHLKAAVTAGSGLPATEADGTLEFRSGRGVDDVTLGFDGTMSAAGSIPLPGGGTTIPWRATAQVQAQPGHLEASRVEWRGGVEGRAFVADGTGQWDAGSAAKLVLSTQTLDVGRLASPSSAAANTADPEGNARPPSLSVADALAALKSLALDPDALAGLPVPVDLDARADAVILGNQTLSGLTSSMRLAAGTPIVGTLALAAPDGTAARFDGSFETGPAALFKGKAELSTRSLGRFTQSLAPDLPEAAAWIRQTVPGDAVEFRGAVELSGVGFAARDASLTLDRSHFTGTMTLTRTVGQDRGRFFADLTSDALDLDALPNWRGAAQAASGLDLALNLSARAVQLARTDLGSVEAGRIALQITKTGSAITLDRLSLSDLGGATAELTGRSDGQTAHLGGRFDVHKLHDLAAVLQRVAPGDWTGGLLARADALSPALLTVSADATVAPDGTFAPTSLALEGTAAGTAVVLRLKSVPPTPDAPDDPLAALRSGHAAVTLGLRLDAPEAAPLLRQIGIATTPAPPIGRAHVEWSTRIGGSGLLDGSMTAALGDTAVTLQARGKPDDMTGHAAIHGANVAALVRTLGLAHPDGTAAWSIDVESDLVIRDGRLSTKGLGGQVIGTAFGGDLSYVMPSGTPAAPTTGAVPLTGALSLDRLSLPLLTALSIGPQPQAKPGALWPDVPFGAPVASLPDAAIALTAKTLMLTTAEEAKDARLTLRLGRGIVTLSDLSARLGQGRAGGTLTLRREGPAASLSGHLEWADLPLATPAMAGRSSGQLDLAGSGGTLSGLVGSLAGTGSLTVADGRLPRFDPGALTRVVASADIPNTSLDPGDIAQDVARELDKAALDLGTTTTPVTLAAGVLRSDPANRDGGPVTATVQGSLDLRSLVMTLQANATARTLPPDWSGAPPQVAVLFSGPFAAPQRRVDAAALVSGLAARAITRDQARIDAFQDDIRERAFFAARLRQIEAEQAAKAAAAAAARAEAERQKVGLPPASHPPDGKAGEDDGPAARPRTRRQSAPTPAPAAPTPLQGAASGAAGQQY